MKKPKAIKFRCYCMECSNEDKPEANAPKTNRTAPDQEYNRENGSDLRLAADSIERLLFGA